MGEDQVYEIRVRGHLDGLWLEWFEGMTLDHRPDSTSVLVAPIVDQAALHGLLARVRDLGLPLLSVNRIQAGQESAP
jgi:hypothetical protein